MSVEPFGELKELTDMGARKILFVLDKKNLSSQQCEVSGKIIEEVIEIVEALVCLQGMGNSVVGKADTGQDILDRSSKFVSHREIRTIRLYFVIVILQEKVK